MKNEVIITIENITKTFLVKEQQINVLKTMSCVVEKGDFLIIFGPSGCGKSTLLHILLGLEIPTSGSIIISNNNIYENTTEDMRSEFRKKYIGMVYQQPIWIQAFNVVENIIFPLLLVGQTKEAALVKGYQMLESMGMQKWSEYKPTELSSGQQQKIALLRALVTNPDVIIADEPTGNLDYESGRELMQLLQTLHVQGKTIIMVTHDLEYLQYAKTALQMFDGKIVKTFLEQEKKELLKRIQTKKITLS